MIPCPHGGGGLLICSPCVQRIVEPPVRRDRDQRDPSKPRQRRPRAWVVHLPDGTSYTYEGVSLATARGALRRTLGHRAPPGSRWEGRR